MTAEKFKSICEYKGITWNDLVRIRIIRPKKFLGFFRQLTGITIEGAFNRCSACVEIMANDDNGVSMMHYIDYEDIIGVELIKVYNHLLSIISVATIIALFTLIQN